jgi:hypothetical protein
MRDQTWEQQVMPADAFLQALGEIFGARRIDALLPDAIALVERVLQARVGPRELIEQQVSAGSSR